MVDRILLAAEAAKLLNEANLIASSLALSSTSKKGAFLLKFIMK